VTDGCSHYASSHTCDTRIGNSGSPLFEVNERSRDQWVIRAVHFAGLTDERYNLATPIDDKLFQWIDCHRTGKPVCSPAAFMTPLR
jgi:V8-like Glu-specific endopeptidase